MKSFDVLIIGGGVAGLSCALILGSAINKPFAIGKKIGIISHQKSSALKSAILNNVLGFEKGTTGDEILSKGLSQYAIATGSGAQVATDILKIWNNGNITMIHDVVK